MISCQYGKLQASECRRQTLPEQATVRQIAEGRANMNTLSMGRLQTCKTDRQQRDCSNAKHAEWVHNGHKPRRDSAYQQAFNEQNAPNPTPAQALTEFRQHLKSLLMDNRV